MFKYLIAFTVPLAGYFSMRAHGGWTFSLLVYALILIPIFEYLAGLKEKNTTTDPRKSRYYMALLLLMVPIQYFLLWMFLSRWQQDLSVVEGVGLVLSMGVLCGVIGINVGHELGHRKDKWAKFGAHALLLTSLYLHFHIEHNKGHHKRVATPEDPASAPKGMSVYKFWYRSVTGSFISAWEIEQRRLERKNVAVWSPFNQMLRYITIELIYLAVITAIFGWMALVAAVLAAFVGILLLETINYIEHYGLTRKEIKPGIYELPQPQHSWNCDYVISRALLFELTLHPAHHKNSSIPYQDLTSTRVSPSMPTGYAGMVLLSFFPKLFFRIMDKRIPSDQADQVIGG